MAFNFGFQLARRGSAASGRRKFAVKAKSKRWVIVAGMTAVAALIAGGYASIGTSAKLRVSQQVQSKQLQPSSVVGGALTAAQIAASAAQNAVAAAKDIVSAAVAGWLGGRAAGNDAADSIGKRTWAEELDASRQAEAGGAAAGAATGPDVGVTPKLPCMASGYCSVGKMGEPYIGEVDSTAGLKAALKAAAYKRDVFMLTIGDRDHVMGMNFGEHQAGRVSDCPPRLHCSRHCQRCAHCAPNPLLLPLHLQWPRCGPWAWATHYC